MPHDGADGLALTLALCAAYPAGLWAARFLTEEERERLGALFARVRSGEVLRRELDDREAAGGVGDRPGCEGRGPRRELARGVGNGLAVALRGVGGLTPGAVVLRSAWFGH